MYVDPTDVLQNLSDLRVCLGISLLLCQSMHVTPPRAVGSLRMLLNGSSAYCQHRRIRMAAELLRRQNSVEPVKAAKHLLPIWRQLTVLTGDSPPNAEAR
jgi:hypothetical protein